MKKKWIDQHFFTYHYIYTTIKMALAVLTDEHLDELARFLMESNPDFIGLSISGADIAKAFSRVEKIASSAVKQTGEFTERSGKYMEEGTNKALKIGADAANFAKTNYPKVKHELEEQRKQINRTMKVLDDLTAKGADLTAKTSRGVHAVRKNMESLQKGLDQNEALVDTGIEMTKDVHSNMSGAILEGYKKTSISMDRAIVESGQNAHAAEILEERNVMPDVASAEDDEPKDPRWDKSVKVRLPDGTIVEGTVEDLAASSAVTEALRDDKAEMLEDAMKTIKKLKGGVAMLRKLKTAEQVHYTEDPSTDVYW
jgi:hypothetical protein